MCCLCFCIIVVFINAKDYNIRFVTGESAIKPGDRVFVKRLAPRKHKLQSKFLGPFRIMEKKGQAVKVKNLSNGKVSEVHLSHVLLAKESEIVNISNGKVVPPIFPTDSYDLSLDVEGEEQQEENE